MAAAPIITAQQAHTATACSRCGATSDQLWFTYRDQDWAVTVRVASHASPSHAHCRPCADRYRKIQNRRMQRKALADRVKAQPRNQFPDDCVMVAVATAANLRYDQVLARAKRKDVGYQPGKGGLGTFQQRTLWAWAETKCRKPVQRLFDRLDPADFGSSYTVADFLRNCDPKARYYVAATNRRGGHAMAVVNGELKNGGYGWYHAQLHSAYKVG